MKNLRDIIESKLYDDLLIQFDNELNDVIEYFNDKHYSDSGWTAISELRKALDKLVKKFNKENDCNFNSEITTNEDDHIRRETDFNVSSGGYKKSRDKLTQWKQYYILIYDGNKPVQLIGVKLFGIGSQDDPFDTYEVEITY